MSEGKSSDAVRQKRHRVGLATRLDAIQAELAERGARIEKALADLTVRLEHERAPAASSRNKAL